MDITEDFLEHYDLVLPWNAELKLAEIGPSIGMTTLTINNNNTEVKNWKELWYNWVSYLEDKGIPPAIYFNGFHFRFIPKSVDSDYRQDMVKWLREISKKCLDFQKDVFKSDLTKYRPPFFTLVTNCNYYTGKDAFYTLFNFVEVVFDKNEKEFVYDFGALGELLSYPFTAFIFNIENEEDINKALNLITNHENAFSQIFPARIHLLIKNEEPNLIRKTLEVAAKYNFKVSKPLIFNNQ